MALAAMEAGKALMSQPAAWGFWGANERIDWGCRQPYLFFSGSSIFGNAPSGVNNGYSGWYKLFYSLRAAEIETGFWSSHNFYAPNGNFIFSSFSDYQENLIISDRKIITGLLNIRLLYSDLLEFYAGFNGYYDTSLKHFDYAFSIHLRFNKLIKIASIRK
jgi:hypothetical protein